MMGCPLALGISLAYLVRGVECMAAITPSLLKILGISTQSTVQRTKISIALSALASVTDS